VSIFRPKHNRARFTRGFVGEKLLRTFPWVRDPKVKNPDKAMRRHANMEMVVE
jgi:hypothetical protein